MKAKNPTFKKTLGPKASRGLAQRITSVPPHLLRQMSDTIARGVIKRLVTLRSQRRKPARKKKGENLNPLVIDTSALIDSRIAEVAETGFLVGTLLVPKFILAELRHIADSPDPLRRGRGRRGLEILGVLKKAKDLKFKILEEEPPGRDVDEKLVHLAKEYRAKILTCDFNLNKVAQIRGIRVLNINDLAQRLKTIVLPGEELTLKIIQEGKGKNQGVGYLPDGTMIVVEEGKDKVGQEATVVVSRVLQTVAGRMIFAKPR